MNIVKNIQGVANGTVSILETASQLSAMTEFKQRAMVLGFNSIMLLNLIGIAIGNALRNGLLKTENVTDEELLRTISTEFESTLTSYIRNNWTSMPAQCQQWYKTVLELERTSIMQQIDFYQSLTEISPQQQKIKIKEKNMPVAYKRKENQQLVVCATCQKEGVSTVARHKYKGEYKYYDTVRHIALDTSNGVRYHDQQEISNQEYEDRRNPISRGWDNRKPAAQEALIAAADAKSTSSGEMLGAVHALMESNRSENETTQ